MPSLTSNYMTDALEKFRADAGGMPRKFHSDFDKKLIGDKALKWILSNDSKVIAARHVANHPTTLWNAPGDRSSPWLGRTLRRSKWGVSFGTLQLFTQH